MAKINKNKFDSKIHEAFVYKWVRITTGEFYVGVHCGTPDDGYIGSGHVFKDKYFSSSEEWVRECVIPCNTFEDALELEELIVTEELIMDTRCLNLKTGGQNGKHNETTKEKISSTMIGVPKSESHKQNMKKPKTREHALKVGKAQRKKVRCVETGVIYDSIKDAAEFVGLIPRSCNIGAVCEGRRKSAGGYRWERV